MKRFGLSILAACLMAAVVASVSRSQAAGIQSSAARHQVTKAEYEHWKTELKNWGRWGKDDELGTLNLITPAKRKQAAALVKEGVSVSLARDAIVGDGSPEARKPASGAAAPYQRVASVIGDRSFTGGTRGAMFGAGASDRLEISYHGGSVTHLDSLSHRWFDTKTMFNGFSTAENTPEKGAAKMDMLTVKNGIVTRGVLIDLPRLKGVPYLEPSTRIYPEDLEAWEKKAGVKVSPGDALFIRTGRWAHLKASGKEYATGTAPGLDPSVLPWFKKRDIALLANEGAGGEAPAIGLGDMPALAIHDFVLSVLGLHLIDNADLDAASEAAAAQNRWEFLVVIAALPIPGGNGSPLNPVAVF